MAVVEERSCPRFITVIRDHGREGQPIKELHARYREIQEILPKLPENRECTNCKSKGTRWASANLSIFIYMQSFGTHRSLVAHLSKSMKIRDGLLRMEIYLKDCKEFEVRALMKSSSSLRRQWKAPRQIELDS